MINILIISLSRTLTVIICKIILFLVDFFYTTLSPNISDAILQIMAAHHDPRFANTALIVVGKKDESDMAQ